MGKVQHEAQGLDLVPFARLLGEVSESNSNELTVLTHLGLAPLRF